MYCKNCGKEIDSEVCSNCGTVNNTDSSKTNSKWNNLSKNNNNDNNSNQSKKPVYKKWWFWVIIVVVIIGVSSNFIESEDTSSKDNKPKTSQNDNISKKEPSKPKEDASQKEKPKKEISKPKEDFSSVAKEYTLTAGNYVAGIDLPSGVCDVVAVSGNGNINSSNLYSGGINEMFGVDDGSGIYTSSFNGLKFPKNTVLTTNGDLVIKLTFKQINSNFKGRIYDENSAIALNSGNYTSGTDFPAGVYKVIAVSGNGNLSSSNLYQGGLNEMFGIDDGSGFYNNQFLNVDLPKGVTLEVSGGLSIKLIPAKNN